MDSTVFGAISTGNLYLLQSLVDEKNVNTIIDAKGHTLLFLACINGNPAMMKWLISIGADVNIPDRAELTPLEWVVDSGYRKGARVLLEAGACTTGIGLLYGQGVRHPTCLALVLAAAPETAFELDAGQQTPLHVAAKWSRQSTELLLDARCPIDALDKFGHTPLHCAILHGGSSTIQLLLDRGADIKKLLADVKLDELPWIQIFVQKRTACRAASRAILSLKVKRLNAKTLGDNGKDVLVIIARMIWGTRQQNIWGQS
jgi:ankyrin repeat protein